MTNIEETPQAVPADTEKTERGRAPHTLRVRGAGDPNDPDKSKRPTDPDGLGRSILHVLAQNDFVQIETVGPIAEKIATEAFIFASLEAEKRTQGSCLVKRQTFYTATIGGQPTRGIRTRIFPIPIKYAI